MIDISDPSAVARELDEARTFRAKHTKKIREIEERFIGNWYRMDYASEPSPENQLFSFIAFMLPELCFTRPQVRVRADWPIQYQGIADAMEAGLDAWIRTTDFFPHLRRTVLDMFFGYGVMKVGLEEDPQRPGILRPYAIRKPRDKFLIPFCEAAEEAPWMADDYEQDLDAVMADERFDREVVEQLAVDIYDPSKERGIKEGELPPRKTITLVDIWFRDTGMLATMAKTGDGTNATYVRPPRKYWGPDDGPYKIFGLYDVPGDPLPMAPLQSIMDQFIELQTHLKTAGLEAANMKNIVLVDAAAPGAKNAVITGENGSVYSVPNLSDKQIKEISLGGLHPQRLVYLQDTRNRMDRVIGFSEAQRGRASAPTATEANIIQSNADLRTKWMQLKTVEQTAAVLRKVAWYFFNEQNIAKAVTIRDDVSGTVREGMFYGGPRDGVDIWGNIQHAQDQQAVTLNDFTIDVEEESMQRSDNIAAQQRLLQAIQLTGTMAQAMMTMPQVNWRWLYDKFGDSMNIHRMSDLIFRGAMGPAQPMMGQPGMQPQGAPPVSQNMGGQPAMPPPQPAGMPSVPQLQSQQMGMPQGFPAQLQAQVQG